MGTTEKREDLDALAAVLGDRRVLVLSGAGISTESGIPDYRSPRPGPRRPPIRFQEFVGDERIRRRYWARSSVGWRRVVRAEPNPGHHALSDLERDGRVLGVITQNVDGLHQAAGSLRVLELHGSLSWVRCLGCSEVERRDRMQQWLIERNPALAGLRAPTAPDGDALLEGVDLDAVSIPACRRCGGVLKPDVVFFGENVPPERVDEAWGLFEQADVLLVVGSSLTVFSGYRFVLRASKEGVPVVIVNDGETRGDALATVRASGRLGTILPELALRLGS